MTYYLRHVIVLRGKVGLRLAAERNAICLHRSMQLCILTYPETPLTKPLALAALIFSYSDDETLFLDVFDNLNLQEISTCSPACVWLPSS